MGRQKAVGWFGCEGRAESIWLPQHIEKRKDGLLCQVDAAEWPDEPLGKLYLPHENNRLLSTQRLKVCEVKQREARKMTNEFFNTVGSNRNRQVVCADGFKMSVQAFAGGYCTPRTNNADRYEEVEVGYPSAPEELLMDWAEEPDKPTQTIYAYVPVQVVTNVIVKHGGIVDGEIPKGVAPIPANFMVDI